MRFGAIKKSLSPATLPGAFRLFVLLAVFMHNSICSAQGGGEARIARGRIDAGLQRLLSSMKTEKKSVYPLWQRNASFRFYVFSGESKFYAGMLFAYLNTFSNVTGTKFDLGDHPRLVVILAEHLQSWKDVNDFLSTQNTRFQLPNNISSGPFTGCDVINYFDKGLTELGILIVDVTQERAFAQIDSCIYRSLMSVFGFEPELSPRNTTVDLELLRALYDLNAEERTADKLVNALIRRFAAEQ